MYAWVHMELVTIFNLKLSSISGCHCSTVAFNFVRVRRATGQGHSCALVPVGVQELSRLGVLSWFRIHETCGSKTKIDINAVSSFGNRVLTRSETVLAGVRRLKWQG